MKKVLYAGAALALLITAHAALAQGQAPICLSTRNIADTSASPDGKVVFFRMTDGRIWRNDLRGRCPDLKWAGFTWTSSDPMERICENEQTIRAIQVPEVCALGKFTELFPPGPPRFATGER
jgi:hypothetical protein